MQCNKFCFLLVLCFTAFGTLAAQDEVDENVVVLDTTAVYSDDEIEYIEEEPATTPASYLYDYDSINVKPFDKKKWKSITEHVDYSEEHEEEEEKKEKDSKNGGLDMPSLPFQISSQFVKIALVSALVLGGLFVLFLIFKDAKWLNRQKQEEAEDLGPIDIENELPEKEQLRKMMQDAVKKGDLRTAIRYYYLMVIAHYRALGYIKWKKDKTNSQYLREMSKHSLHADMKAATYVFERTWYGDTVVDNAMFEQAETIFNKLLNSR